MIITDAAKHEKAFYLDMEFTCWDGPPPVGLRPEIIEIGAVEMDLDSLHITKERTFFVRPRHLEISTRCSDITGISVDDLRAAPPFDKVLGVLIDEFRPSERLCCSWGNDADLLSEACRSCGMRSPLRNVVDLSHFVWRLFLLLQRPSVRSAIEILGLRFEGAAHTALADARNTARVHAEILRRMRNHPDRDQSLADSHQQEEGPTVLAEKLIPLLKDGRLQLD
jgi:inhibitor of KinA sporulation pathway (predicted exonuclease)